MKRKHIGTMAAPAQGLLWATLAWVITAVPGVFARELPKEDVSAAVRTWVRYVTADARPKAEIERMEPYQVDGRTMAYIAHLEERGFCLCGANELVLPVYYYAPGGTYDPASPDLKFILRSIARRTSVLEEAERTRSAVWDAASDQLAERAAWWTELAAGRVPAGRTGLREETDEPDFLELPLTCRWSQDSPYNDQCPVLTPGSDEHCLVGCGATAMAQLMYYWQWPSAGEGQGHVQDVFAWKGTWLDETLGFDPGISQDTFWTNRLRWSAAAGGKLQMRGYWDGTVLEEAETFCALPEYYTALHALYDRLDLGFSNYNVDFSAATYDWSVLQDQHADPAGPAEAEVAKLCHHAGVAANMRYNYFGSGLDPGDVEDALVDHFRYSGNAHVLDYFDPDRVVSELLWMRPVMMNGETENGQGHGWVVFGFNRTSGPWLYKMNMGWGGDAGWWTRDDVPKGLNENQGLLVYIAPRVVKFVGTYQNQGNGNPIEPYPDIETAAAQAPDGSTLVFKVNTVNTFSNAPLRIAKPLTLKGINATITSSP